MYGRAKTWTCQSLAKDVCKEQMPRCKFQSEMSEAVKAFLQKITEQMHPEVGVYLQTEDWNDDDAHPNHVEMSTRRTLRFIMFYSCTWHLFHQSKLQAVAHLSSLSTWYSQADPGLGPHTTGAIPRCQAEALHRRALAGREAHLGANHPHTLESMNNLATLLEQQGKLNEAGLRVFGLKRGKLPGGRFTFLVWPRPEACIFFLFPGFVETMWQVIHLCNYLSSLQGFLSVYVLAFVSHTSWQCAHPRQNLMKV